MATYDNRLSCLLAGVCNRATPSRFIIKNNLIAQGPPIIYFKNRYARNTALCRTTPQLNYKVQTINRQPGFTGMSQKMAYGLYTRTTPGLTTFANKKVPDNSVRTTFTTQRRCLGLGNRIDARLQNCQITNIHPSIQRKMTCVNTRTCKVSDATPLRPLRRYPMSMIYR
jgi:hypothetical protein